MTGHTGGLLQILSAHAESDDTISNGYLAINGHHTSQGLMAPGLVTFFSSEKLPIASRICGGRRRRRGGGV